MYSGYSNTFSYNELPDDEYMEHGGGNNMNMQQPYHDMQNNTHNPYREEEEERPNVYRNQHRSDNNPDYYSTDENVKLETKRNIKLLKDVVNVSVSAKPTRSKEPKESKKPKHEQYNQNLDDLIDYIRDPLIMFLLYIIIHSEAANDMLSSYLPSNYNNPVNIIKYYGARGFVYIVLFYVFRRYN